MRLTSFTPRLFSASGRAVPERPVDRELRMVREEAGAMLQATATPAGLTGAVSTVYGTVVGAPSTSGRSLSGFLEKTKAGIAALTGRLGRWLSPGGDWSTPLPPVTAQPAPAKPTPKPKPAPKATPKPKPTPKPKAAPKPKPAPKPEVTDKLKTMSAAQLAHLGRTNKKAFFEALRPAAEAAEKKYGVPAAVTMAQAALETGWGAHIIPGHNIFGIKGKGPAGTVKKKTWEVYGGKTVTIDAHFAKYHDFSEAVELHGKLFHNGYYKKALKNFKKYQSAERFAQDITGTYATDPSYGAKLISIMRAYKL